MHMYGGKQGRLEILTGHPFEQVHLVRGVVFLKAEQEGGLIWATFVDENKQSYLLSVQSLQFLPDRLVGYGEHLSFCFDI